MLKKILIVDDDRLLVDSLKDYLEDCGYEVLTAYDGAGTPELVRTHLPALIILDVDMPVVNGIQTLQKLRMDPATCRIPVILMTGVASAQVYPAIASMPMVSHIKKPIEPEDLLSVVKYYVPSPH